MVKVINTAPHASVVKQVICRNCGSTLEYTPNDVIEHKVRDYGGGTDIEKYIDCPNCHTTLGVR
jgi:5-methylcytosine-specific restriction endonuclease McrA